MQRALSVLAGLLLITATAGCDLLSMFDSVACMTADFPRCADQRRVQRCSEGEIEEQSCGPGQRCLPSAPGADHRWAECVDADEQPCAVDLDQPTCTERGIQTCVFPGYTATRPCAADETCVEGRDRLLCAQAGSASCDPETYVEVCDGERPTHCDHWYWVVVFEEPCAAPEVCQVGTRGAVCTGPGAVSCDASSYITTCDGDVVERCNSSTGFTERIECTAPERCRASSTSARCFDDTQPDCDAATFVGRCEGDVRIYCGSYGVEEDWSCSAFGEVCRQSTAGTACVDADAQACDPATYGQNCDGNDYIFCPAEGWTRRRTCASELVCMTSPIGGYCVEPATETCDPSSYEATCQDQTALTCSGYGFVVPVPCTAPETCRLSPLGAACTDATGATCDLPYSYLRCDGADIIVCDHEGFERGSPCQPPTTCREGDLRYLDNDNAAWCVDDGAATCDGSVPVACDNSGDEGRIEICFGGYVMEESCGAGGLCVTDGEAWTCVFTAPSSCDPQTYVDSCSNVEVLQRCFGDPPVEVEIYCRWGCGDVGQGAGCLPP